MPFFLIALVLFIVAPDVAHAGPVFFAALSGGAGLGAAFGATALGTFLNTTIGKLLFTVASSALQAALQKKPTPPGIVTESTLTGSRSPLSFIIGRYATGGVLQGPLRSHGKAGKTPNAYRTAIVVLGAVPGMQMSRLMLNGEYVELGTAPHADYGLPVLGRFEGYAWCKYYDGTQTAADPMLVAKYGADPDRPITASFIGTGLCYAILTFRLSQTVWPSGEPSWRFEMDGIPLYDPRKDSTVGGSGAHRWSNTATWTHSDNPLVQAYNILRGIDITGLGVWGGRDTIDAEDLPLSSWFAAMNICDQAVTRPGGASEPRYRTGMEVTINKEPADVVEELFKASATQIAEVGGIWKPRTGGPGLPVYFMTDDDIITSAAQELDPFPGADQRFNGIATSGPSPDAVWEAEPDPERYNAAWEVEDGGKRRMASLDLPACPYPLQRQRVGRAYIKDERRFRRHQHLLPSDAAILEPLDTLAWTSTKYGYATKHFEIGDMQDDIVSIQQSVALREVDPTDYADPPEFGEIILPVPTTRPPVPAQVLQGFTAIGGATVDAAGNPRRPHAVLEWDGDEQDGVSGIEWEIRLLAGGVEVSRGSTSNVEAGRLRVFDGIIRNTWYQARARQIAPWPVVWTGWVTFQSSNIGMMADDMADAFIAEIENIAKLAGVTTVATLPASGDKPDQVVMLVPPGRLYRWDAASVPPSWSDKLYGGVEPGSLDIAAFAAGIRPVELWSELPTTGNFDGRMVYRTSDKTQWRHNGTEFINSNAADQIVGQLIASQIAAGAIGADQLAAGAIVARHLLVTDFSNMVPDSNLSDLVNWNVRGSGWSLAPQSSVETFSAGRCVKFTGSFSTTTSSFYGDFLCKPVPVEVGKVYTFSTKIDPWSGATGTIALVYTWYDASGAEIGRVNTLGDAANYAPQTVTAQAEAPAGATHGAVGWRRGSTATGGSFTGTIHCGDLVMRRAVDASLVVNGAIKAIHLAVETLLTNSAQIGAAIINNGHLANATITTAKIADAQITGAKIANLAVDTAQLASAAVENAKIANLAVSGAKIADLTVGTIKITDDAITNGVGASISNGSGTNTTHTRDVTISCLAGSKVALWVKMNGYANGTSPSITLRIRWNGTVIFSLAQALSGTLQTAGGVIDEMKLLTAIAGTNTLRFECIGEPNFTRSFGPAIMIEMKK